MLFLDKFIELVERSQLIDAERLSQAIVDWKSRATLRQMADAQCCADHLVSQGLVTEWQCAKLLEGRYRGFFLGKYKLLDHLGSGGMSSVYLAEHVLMQRRVAIKVLPHNRVGDSSYLARFHFEAQAVAALDHRNIVRAYDLDNEGKIHYLVMEYVEGRDLDAIVSQDGPLDFHTAANLIAQAAAGLDHAHHSGVVHRDIKPANLLVDLKGTVKILDMGLAKFTSPNRPEPGFNQDEHVLGTADYLAPEQAVNSQTVDHRADIYALGCTLYFLLTGHPPFADGTSLERMAAHQQQLPPSLVVERPDAPPALVAICRRMMEKSAANRYQSASEVQRALVTWLDSETALGHVRSSTLVTAARGSSTSRRPGKSKANLVSGSASDLHQLPPVSPQLSSPLQDTDPNLNRVTAKVPRELSPPKGDSSRAPGSDVLPMPSPPPLDPSRATSGADVVPPPVVTPPRAQPKAAGHEFARQPPAPSEISTMELSSIEFPTIEGSDLVRTRRAIKRATASTWTWAVVFIGLVLSAIALAIVGLWH